MRKPRSWQTEDGRYFHCISRVVDRQLLFGEAEREVFRQILHQVAAFTGVEVLTWTILSNHFHVLVHVPDHPKLELTDAQLLDRIAQLYSPKHVQDVKWQLDQWSQPGFDKPKAELRERYLCRMCNLSEFMKSLKQRFSSWYNRSHARKGTLWEERFRSVSIGGSWDAILTVAAYIDLNCVRAGLANDPKGYRWCGYAEAVAGNRQARKGLAHALEDNGQSGDWRHTGAVYRRILFGNGEQTASKRGFDKKQIQRVLANNGKLSRTELLRCRVRYFTDSAVLGTPDFVNAFFQNRKRHFGPNRRTGARTMKGGDWGNLASLRDLRLRPVSLE